MSVEQLAACVEVVDLLFLSTLMELRRVIYIKAILNEVRLKAYVYF